MNRGYVKLWRKTLDAGWLQNHKLFAFWCWSLMKASHKEYDLIVGYTQVHLMPGEFVFGIRKASAELNISVQSLRTILECLKTSGNLTLKPTHQFSIITITNWETYQQTENIINTPTNTQVTHDQHTSNNKQECKEHKNVKKVYIPLSFENIKLTQKEYDNLNLKYGQQLIQKALKYYSDYKIEKNYKSNSDNLTIQRWVIDAVNKKEAIHGTGNGTFKRQIRTERDAINQTACDEADIIAREYYLKHPPADGKA